MPRIQVELIYPVITFAFALILQPMALAEDHFAGQFQPDSRIWISKGRRFVDRNSMSKAFVEAYLKRALSNRPDAETKGDEIRIPAPPKFDFANRQEMADVDGKPVLIGGFGPENFGMDVFTSFDGEKFAAVRDAGGNILDRYGYRIRLLRAPVKNKGLWVVVSVDNKGRIVEVPHGRKQEVIILVGSTGTETNGFFTNLPPLTPKK